MARLPDIESEQSKLTTVLRDEQCQTHRILNGFRRERTSVSNSKG